MKNTIITTALVAIVGLAFVGASMTAQAQTSTNAPVATAPATKAKKAQKTQYKGSITAIDASSVTVASKEKTLTLAITPTTKFLVDKAPATLADFAVGDAVTGSYTKDSTGAMSAASLHKKKSAASKPAATAPAATTTPAAQ
jgi:riboflavin synthase alpha subunit